MNAIKFIVFLTLVLVGLKLIGLPISWLWALSPVLAGLSVLGSFLYTVVLVLVLYIAGEICNG